MIVAATAWHILGAALIFLVGLIATFLLAKKLRLPQKAATFLYFWHTFFSMVYLWYSLNNPADSTLYYDRSLIHLGGFKPGTEFVSFLTSLFTQGLGLSYLGAFLVYNTIGACGLLAFASSVRTAVNGKSRRIRQVGWVVLLLPSVSFWSGAIGKDAISFMSACLFLWSGLEVRRRVAWLVFAVVAMFLVRPHIASLMLFAIAIGVIFSAKSGLLLKIVLGLTAVGGASVMVPFALQYSGLGDAQQAGDIADYVAQRQNYNQEGGGGIDISGMSPPMQLFTYLYRPLPYEAHSAMSLAASLENVGLIFLTIAAVRVCFQKRRHIGKAKRNVMLGLYAGGAWLILAITTANLGIAVRQKWMFAPILLYLALSLVGRAAPTPTKHGVRELR